MVLYLKLLPVVNFLNVAYIFPQFFKSKTSILGQTVTPNITLFQLFQKIIFKIILEFFPKHVTPNTQIRIQLYIQRWKKTM